MGGKQTKGKRSKVPEEPAPKQDKSSKRFNFDKYGGKKRGMTMVFTDKPIYRPGDYVDITAVALNCFTRQAIFGRHKFEAKITGPSGDVVLTSSPRFEDGVGGFRWKIPDGQSGGDYTIAVQAASYGVRLAPSQRTFNIRSFRSPRLNTQLEFVRRGYGAGDTVTAILQAKRAEGGVPAGAKATASASVDGVVCHYESYTIGADGILSVSFQLPDNIDAGQGSLSIAIDDGGLIETTTRTIPILLKSLHLDFFPESGRLVFGAPGRVYVQAFTPYGDPADITADLLCEGEEAPVATVSTKHEGRGVSTPFVPKKGVQYTIRVTNPSGIDDIPVPADIVVDKAVSIMATKEVYDSEDDITVTVAVAENDAEKYEVHLYQREELLASQTAPSIPKGHKDYFQSTVTLKTPQAAAGVLRVAVQHKGETIAERLVFRRPLNPLHITVKADRDTYCPGDDVSVTVTVTSKDGAPVRAALCVTASDESVRELLETRKQPPRLPVSAWLENEVETLEDPGMYFSDKELANTSIDLILGVQGWRFLAYEDVNKFLDEYKENAKRVLSTGEKEEHQIMKKGARNMMMFKNEVDDDSASDGDDYGDASAGLAPPMAAFAFAEEVPLCEGAPLEEIPVALNMLAPPPAPGAPAPPPPPAPGAPAPPPPPLGMKEVAADEDEMEEWDEPPSPEMKLARMDMDIAEDDLSCYETSYVHERAADFKLGVRKDFTETVFWSSALQTDEKGVATFRFALNDAVTSFRVMVDGFSVERVIVQGSVGSGDVVLRSVQPFYAEPKVPLEVTSGDEVSVAVSLANATKQSLSCGATLTCKHEAVAVNRTESTAMEVPAESRARFYIPMSIGDGSGAANINVTATASSADDSLRLTDDVTRTSEIVPIGFPIRAAFGGVLNANSKVQHVVDIPANFIAGSVKTAANVFATPTGTLLQAVQGLIQDPYGCFEQASSTNYPLVMALQYINKCGGVPPSIIADIKKKLESGYKKLMGYESETKGFEWFGDSPAHEALTAYGVMEFRDMAEVFEVDKDMLKRSHTWLNACRDGKGSFTRNSTELDTFGGAPQTVTDAYILWAMTEAKVPDLNKEIAAIKKLLENSKDPYELALLALILHNTQAEDEAVSITKSLATQQDDNGSIPGAKTSITCSGGVSLVIETTSLFILSALRQEHGLRNHVDKAAKWLYSQCNGGTFGATQSTILALKAIVQYETERAAPRAAGSVHLTVNGFVAGEVFDETKTGTIHLASFAEHLVPGPNTIELRMDQGSTMNYSLEVDFNTPQPDSSAACVLDLEVGISAQHLLEGETADVHVKLTNKSAEGKPMTVAIIGLPGGFEPRIKKLQELREAKVISSYELRGSREVVLYWRGLAPNQVVELAFDGVAAVPGKYTAPPSRTYLYYTNELKKWVDPLKLAIAPVQKAAE